MPLEHFGALALAGVPMIDLQYGDTAAERARFEERHPGSLVHLDDLDASNDLEGILAAIAACDLVATASNATAHLAGALGKRTLLFYRSALPPFHYWAPDRAGRSPWYPAVEIVSAPQWTGWDSVMHAVASKVREALTRRTLS